MSNRKRPRQKKVSAGLHGGGRVRTMTPVQKVLLGRGLIASFAPIGSIRHD